MGTACATVAGRACCITGVHHHRSSPTRVRLAALTLLCTGCAIACTAAGLLAAPAGAAPALAWSAPLDIDGAQALSGLSCTSLSLCVAVDGAGNVIVSSNPAAGPSATWRSRAVDGGRALTAITCPSAALCVAVDGGGYAVVSTDPGAGSPAGSAAAWKALEIDNGQALDGVSCASTTLCVAVDNAGHALFSTNPAAGIWSDPASSDVDATNRLTGVSCASSALCAAVDSDGQVLLSTNPTGGPSAWHAREIDPSLTLKAISCSSDGICAAVDGVGNALASGNAGAAIAGGTPGSGATWSSTAFDPFGAPTAIACAATGLCVAGDDTGYAFASDDPAAAPPAWPASALDISRTLTATSCVSEGLCAAVDANGRAFTATVRAPTATTGSALEVGHTSAILTGLVDPEDAAVSCRFEYGTSTAYGTTVPCASTPGGSAEQTVSATLTNLAANTTYYYRLVASTAIGTGEGGGQTFKTLAPNLVEPHPSIAGTPAPGQHLTCKSGVTAAGVTLAYAWLRDTQAIAGASGSTYVVSAADVSHHLQCRVTATTAEGSKSTTSAFVTVPAGGLGTISETTVGTPHVGRNTVSVPLKCSAQAAGRCTLALRLTVQETLSGTRILAVAARTRRLTVTVGASTVHLKAGQQSTATVALNATGRRLLASRRRMAVKLSISGTVVGAISASLKSATLTLAAPARASAHKASSKRTR
jgi:hypothetical protein